MMLRLTNKSVGDRLLCFLVIVFYIFVSFGIDYPLSDKQTELAVVARTILSPLNPISSRNFFNWAISLGNVYTPVPILAVLPRLLSLSNSAFRFLSVWQIAFFLVIVIWFCRKVIKPEVSFYWFLAILFFSPWFFENWFFYPDRFFLLAFFLLSSGFIFGEKRLTFLAIGSLFLMGLSHPLGFLIAAGLLIYFLFNGHFASDRSNRRLVATGVLLLLFFLLSLLNSSFWIKNSIFGSSSPKIREEVVARFRDSDSLVTKVSFPLWFRRIGYNKLSFFMKNILDASVEIFDVNHLFFQEIGWSGLKQIPPFFWWEIFFLIWSVVYWSKLSSGLKNFIKFCFVQTFLISVIFPHLAFLEKSLLFLPMFSIIIGSAIHATVEEFKLFKLPAMLLLLLSVILVYGNFLTRPLFWFDNHWYVYDRIADWLENNPKQVNTSSLVQITTMVGPSFWPIYLKQGFDPDSFWLETNTGQSFRYRQFKFAHFNPEQIEAFPGNIFIGFSGEFLGSKKDNDFSKMVLPANSELLATFRTHDLLSNENGYQVLIVRFNYPNSCLF